MCAQYNARVVGRLGVGFATPVEYTDKEMGGFDKHKDRTCGTCGLHVCKHVCMWEFTVLTLMHMWFVRSRHGEP